MKNKFYFKTRKHRGILDFYNELEFKKEAKKHGWTDDEIDSHLKETLQIFLDSNYNFDSRNDCLLKYHRSLDEVVQDVVTRKEISRINLNEMTKDELIAIIKQGQLDLK